MFTDISAKINTLIDDWASFIYFCVSELYIYIYITTPPTCSSWSITTAVVKICHRHSPKFCLERNSMVNTMGWNERSDPDMRTANFCDVYREGVYWNCIWPDLTFIKYCKQKHLNKVLSSRDSRVLLGTTVWTNQRALNTNPGVHEGLCLA